MAGVEKREKKWWERFEKRVRDGIADSIDGVGNEFQVYLNRLIKSKRSKKTRVGSVMRRKFKLSHRTLFYIKEYSNKSNIPMTIIKQSLKILIIASLLSSVGGIGLQYVKENIITILPLLIVLPALTDMIGDFGTITSSKFTTLLFFRAVKRRWWRSKAIHELFVVLFLVSMSSALFIGTFSCLIAHTQGFFVNSLTMAKVLIITTVASVSLFGLIFTISIISGLYIYKKKDDPNNFLIPLTTAIADLGCLILFSALVYLMF